MKPYLGFVQGYMWGYYFLLFQINVFVNHLNGYLSVETEITWFSQALGTLLFFSSFSWCWSWPIFQCYFPLHGFCNEHYCKPPLLPNYWQPILIRSIQLSECYEKTHTNHHTTYCQYKAAQERLVEETQGRERTKERCNMQHLLLMVRNCIETEKTSNKSMTSQNITFRELVVKYRRLY